MTAHTATAQVLVGVRHDKENLGQLVVLVTEDISINEIKALLTKALLQL